VSFYVAILPTYERFALQVLAKYIRFMVQIHLKDKLLERAALMLGVDVIIPSDDRLTFDVVAQWHVSCDTLFERAALM